MKILLDECIDRRLAKEFDGFEIKTVQEMKWSGILKLVSKIKKAITAIQVGEIVVVSET